MKLNWVSKLLLALATVGLVVYVWPKSNKGISKSPPPAVVAVEKTTVEATKPRLQAVVENTAEQKSSGEIILNDDREGKKSSGKSGEIRIPMGKAWLLQVNTIFEPGFEMKKDLWVTTTRFGVKSKPIPAGSAGGKADFVEISATKKVAVEIMYFDSPEERDIYTNKLFAALREER